MELGETTAQAALRETMEGARARDGLDDLFSLPSVPHVNQVRLFYRARLLDRDFAAGDEALEIALFEGSDIHWEAIAFGTTGTTLKHFFEDRRAGDFRLHANETLP